MKKDWLDKKLTQRFRDFDSQMDFENAWNQIEKSRNQKRKKRVVFWFLFIGILVMSSSITFVHFNENKSVLSKQSISVPFIDLKDFQNLSKYI